MTSRSRYLLRRLWQSLITIALVVAVNFALLHLAPGDVVDVLAGEAGSADPEAQAALRASLGLDKPIWTQFAIYVGKLLTFDMGVSLQNQQSVTELIFDRLPATLLLMLPSLAIAFVVGVGLGTWSAMRVNSFVDALISVLALTAYAMPLFWLGLMLIVLFTLQLGVLPGGGMGMIGVEMTWFEATLDLLRHMVLPVLTLSLFYMAVYTRLMRASMLEVASMSFVRTARAKGLREGRVVWRHIVRNALLPVVTMLGLHIGAILGGAVVVEAVFTWPGLGSLAFEAVFRRDNTVLLGLLFFCSLVVVVVNLAVDLLYTHLDPRVDLGGNR